jgi:hypothetical protein
MLNTPAPFPWPGAKALLAGTLVTIIRVNADGSRKVVGAGIDRRVELDELTDASAPADGFEAATRWLADREQSAEPTDFTATVDLNRDFESWLEARGARRWAQPGPVFLSRLLRDRGYRAVTRAVHGHARRGFNLALRPQAGRAVEGICPAIELAPGRVCA